MDFIWLPVRPFLFTPDKMIPTSPFSPFTSSSSRFSPPPLFLHTQQKIVGKFDKKKSFLILVNIFPFPHCTQHAANSKFNIPRLHSISSWGTWCHRYTLDRLYLVQKHVKMTKIDSSLDNNGREFPQHFQIFMVRSTICMLHGQARKRKGPQRLSSVTCCGLHDCPT